MTIRERIENWIRDWIRVRRISPEDPELQRYILAVHWKRLPEKEAMETLKMDPRTFRCYEKAYRRLQRYLCM